MSTTVKSQLLEHTCSQAAWIYWSNKLRFHGMDIESIDWTAIQTVVTGMMIKQCRWMTKFMHWWGKRETSTCPRCEHDTETMVHILQCLHPVVQTISDSCIKDLPSILKDLNTKLETMEDLSKGFNSWHLHQPIPLMCTDAGWLQSFISWDNFSHGFLAANWQTNNKPTMTTSNYDN